MPPSAVETHYDHQANKQISRGQYMAHRKVGPLIKYKDFANKVKRRMFKQYAKNAASLIDLGCGRGGDISKWRDANAQHVLAMDLSAEQLDECRKREKSSGQSKSATRITWLQGSILDAELELKLRPLMPAASQAGGADAVAVMFAVQFAFSSPQHADQLLQTISSLLKPGGYFFGTAPDAGAIATAVGAAGSLHLHPPDHPFSLLLRLLPSESGTEAGGVEGEGGGWYARPLIFSLEDTVTSGTDSSGCIEYLCHRDALVKLAADHGLEPLELAGDWP